jgi:uncharacterized protein YbcV (DUF1398 family)
LEDFPNKGGVYLALTRPSWVVNTIQTLTDQVIGQATTVKQKFDKSTTDIKTFVDAMCTEIEAQFATKTENNLKANSADVYTKTELNAGQLDDRYYTETEADTIFAENAEVVKLTGNQSIDGIKTFTSSPVIPTPTTNFQASTKKYVDDSVAGVVLGQIPDNSLPTLKMATEQKKGVAGGVADYDTAIAHYQESAHKAGKIYAYKNLGGGL